MEPRLGRGLGAQVRQYGPAPVPGRVDGPNPPAPLGQGALGIASPLPDRGGWHRPSGSRHPRVTRPRTGPGREIDRALSFSACLCVRSDVYLFSEARMKVTMANNAVELDGEGKGVTVAEIKRIQRSFKVLFGVPPRMRVTGRFGREAQDPNSPRDDFADVWDLRVGT